MDSKQQCNLEDPSILALLFRSLRKLFGLLLWLLIVTIGFLLFLSLLPLIETDPESYSIPVELSFSGPLSQNDLLSRATRLIENEFLGPESVAPFKGAVFTGTADGSILRIKGNESQTVVPSIGGQDCRPDGIWDHQRCGRPLGMRFDSKGHLYVVDAYGGLKRADISTGKVETLLDTKKGKIAGRKVIFIDDFVVDEGAGSKGGHVFYITDSSAKWEVAYVNLVVLEHESSGRILRFDGDSGSIQVVAEDLSFPNGIELTDNKEAILVNELNERRIWKFYVKGPKAGQKEMFAADLPGYPDNIRRSTSIRETYWVGLYEGYDRNNRNPIYDFLNDKPIVKKLLIRSFYNLGLGLYSVGEIFNYAPLKALGFNIRSFSSWQKLYKGYGLALELDHEGKIIRSLHSPDGRMTYLSEVREVRENNRKVLYLGSFFNNFLGRLEIED